MKTLNDEGAIKQAAQIYGWLNGAWRKSPLPYGYSGDKSQQVSNLNASAGYNQLAGDSVPAGEVWDLQAASAVDIQTSPASIAIYVVVNGLAVVLTDVSSPGASRYVYWSGLITLSEGDRVECSFYGCQAGDDIHLGYHAVVRAVNQ